MTRLPSGSVLDYFDSPPNPSFIEVLNYQYKHETKLKDISIFRTLRLLDYLRLWGLQETKKLIKNILTSVLQ